MFLFSSLLTLLMTSSFLSAEEAPVAAAEPVIQEVAAAEKQELDVATISEAFGHLIGKNIETLGFKFDIEKMIKGIQDAAAGKQSPLSEMECVQAISAAQEASFKEQAKENLKKADEFLSKNSKEEGMVSLDEGKLQYKIEKEGEGAEVQEHFTPLIRYTGKYLDGSVFGASKEDEMIALDETIPGMNKGLIGMKEGEKRTLYIHPDLGYGTSGYLPPNSLLTFEVELVKAQAPQPQESDAISSSNAPMKNRITSEIAAPSEKTETLR